MSKLNIAELFESKESKLTDTILDMYSGKQDKHMITILNSPAGRKDWQSRGIQVRHRNIMKMIVDKSGLLFSDKAPILVVFDSKEDNAPDEGQTATLKEALDKVDWIEFFTNFDSIVRMLKTALVLVQYDNENKTLVLDILTQENSYVVTKGNRIDTLIYKVAEREEDMYEFRVFTKDLIQDILVNEETGEESVLQSIPNPFGIIPVTAFHDTNIPVFDFWNNIPTDLLQINEIYNLNLIDSEYAASWAKLKTLFTNCKIVTAEDMQMESVVPYGSVLPRQAPSQGALIGGPSKVIQIDTMGVDSPFIEYKGPEVNLEPIDNMINKWVSDFASDWSVNVKMAGEGAADSGFKLIVEEMDNLQLRKQRAKMFEAGFARLYQVIKAVVNAYMPGTYSDSSVCFAKFAAPNLPVDIKLQEEVWSRRIAEGRASRLDYFMEVHGMDKAEAQLKLEEIDSVRPALSAPRTLSVTKTTSNA